MKIRDDSYGYIFLLEGIGVGHAQNQTPCGFEKSYPEININNGTLSNVTVDAESFQLIYETTTSALSSQTITISSNGDLLDQSTENTMLDTFIRNGIVDDNSIVFGQNTTDTDSVRAVLLNRLDFQGNEIFRQQYALPVINQVFSIGISGVFATPDNYLKTIDLSALSSTSFSLKGFINGVYQVTLFADNKIIEQHKVVVK